MNPANALQNQVARLRRLLGADGGTPLHTEPDGYRLLLDPGEFDAAEFERLVAASTRSEAPEAVCGLLDQALALWRGPAYGELADRPLIEQDAARLEELRISAVEARAEALLALDRAVDAAGGLTELAAAQPLRERPHALLMRALYATGRQADALDVYHRYRGQLGEELGLEPGPELVELQAKILRHDLSGAARLPGPQPSPPRPPVSSFVGREADVAGVLQRLNGSRLVTICGTGGVGKTRLALEVAARAGPRYPDPVCLVDLATVVHGGDVAPVVASSLRVPERAGTSTVDRMVEALSGRGMLLVLDNCEHVLDSVAALVDTLLPRALGIDVLATSRAALAIDGEHVWPLIPLPVDDGDAPAVRLFADRAAAARPGFVLSVDNSAAVERLCRRLDGLPLALELAAARLRVATVEQVAAAVADRSELLAGARRTGQVRHRSLDALVDWSFRLLDFEEQRLFTRLSVFRGPFTVNDAVAVARGEGLAAAQVPALLWSLVDQSLVVGPASGADAHYVLLETLRSAAGQRLDADGASPRYRQRHADHLLATASTASAALDGPGAPAAVRVLDGLLPELRAARDHLEATGDRSGLLRLTAALFWYGFSGIHSEVLGWARLAADRADVDSDLALLPAVLGAAAMASWQRGDLADRLGLLRRRRGTPGDRSRPGTGVPRPGGGSSRIRRRAHGRRRRPALRAEPAQPPPGQPSRRRGLPRPARALAPARGLDPTVDNRTQSRRTPDPARPGPHRRPAPRRHRLQPDRLGNLRPGSPSARRRSRRPTGRDSGTSSTPKSPPAASSATRPRSHSPSRRPMPPQTSLPCSP